MLFVGLCFHVRWCMGPGEPGMRCILGLGGIWIGRGLWRFVLQWPKWSQVTLSCAGRSSWWIFLFQSWCLFTWGTLMWQWCCMSWSVLLISISKSMWALLRGYHVWNPCNLVTSLIRPWLSQYALIAPGSSCGWMLYKWMCALMISNRAGSVDVSVQYDGFANPVAGPLPFTMMLLLVPSIGQCFQWWCWGWLRFCWQSWCLVSWWGLLDFLWVLCIRCRTLQSWRWVVCAVLMLVVVDRALLGVFWFSCFVVRCEVWFFYLGCLCWCWYFAWLRRAVHFWWWWVCWHFCPCDCAVEIQDVTWETW